MPRLAIAAAIFSAALTLAACTPPESASRSESISVTGTVTAIDQASRRVVVQGQDRTVQYRVSDEVQNFDQVEVGDLVSLDYVESVAVAMADPDDSGEPIVDVFGGRAEPGQRPGALGAMIGTVVVEFISYDPRSHIAQIRTPEGEVVSVSVAQQLRRFASTRQPGDRIIIAIEQAVAVAVTPVT